MQGIASNIGPAYSATLLRLPAQSRPHEARGDLRMSPSRNRQSKDRELEAIGAIISLLDPLDVTERGRVLEYVLDRLEMATVRSPVAAPPPTTGGTTTSPTRHVTDIRSLTAEKQPRSANEMTALIAYYVSELASEGDRSDTVNPEIIRKYFKMAASCTGCRGRAAQVRRRSLAAAFGPRFAENVEPLLDVDADRDEPPLGGRCSCSDPD